MYRVDHEHDSTQGVDVFHLPLHQHQAGGMVQGRARGPGPCHLTAVVQEPPLTCPESVSSHHEYSVAVVQEPEAHLGEVGALSHPVHSTERDYVGPPLALRFHHVPQHVYTALRRQDLKQGIGFKYEM